MNRKLLWAGLLWLIATGGYAADGKPFIHPFGELRVYFRDWLVVCDESGNGSCRMVNYVYASVRPADPFFPKSRLSITPAQAGVAGVIEFYDAGAAADIGYLGIAIDGKQFPLERADYQTPTQTRMMESYFIHARDTLEQVVEHAIPGRWLAISYGHSADEYTTVTFSLLGFTRALEFIRQRNTDLLGDMSARNRSYPFPIHMDSAAKVDDRSPH